MSLAYPITLNRFSRATVCAAAVLLAACGGGNDAAPNNPAQAEAADTTMLLASSRASHKTNTTTSTSPTTPTTSGSTAPITTGTSTGTSGGTTSATITPTSTTTSIGPSTIGTPISSSGKTYYVDAASGNDNNDGRSSSTAWRTLDKVARESTNTSVRPNGFAAGDQILFRRGQAFQTSGYPVIKTAGTASAPVLIDAWGDGAAPTLDNVGPGAYDLVMKIQGSYALIRNLAIVKSNASNVTEVGISLTGSGHRVTACDISGVSIGVRMEGSNLRLDHSNVHDLSMAVADSAPNNDYGAMGVLATSASNLNIDHNHFNRLSVPSPDYGVDGSAFEIYGSASSVYFFANVITASNAMTEIGGNSSSDAVKSIYYHHNVVVNTSAIAAFHNNASTSFGLSIADIHFEHNTFVKNTASSSAGSLLSFDAPAVASQYYFRNNIISYANTGRMFYNSGQLVHQNNLYSLSSASFGDSSYVMNSTEFTGNPQFVNAASSNFRLVSSSPAIDRAVNLGYQYDFDDLSMPAGAGPDVGAMEYR
ncbi:MAG: Hemolysin-type calcium-binding region [Herminiimonas sp.]|nr:Hemolysin-type calcium-binding region [Herminiimonas sp.]MDB5852736.1 Hemolysin-type calcium-binding region [Herminiimonas sp.]